jgi:hypothetical protein
MKIKQHIEASAKSFEPLLSRVRTGSFINGREERNHGHSDRDSKKINNGPSTMKKDTC